jgi:hypothetical protein
MRRYSIVAANFLSLRKKTAAGLRSATAFRFAHMTTRGSPEIVTDYG